MDEIGNENKVEGKKKIRIIIEVDADFDREAYRYDPESDDRLTDEQVEALTDDQMLALDKAYLVGGDYDLAEYLAKYLDYFEVDAENVKLEFVDG